MEDFVTIKKVAAQWDITPRRVQRLCAEGKIPGAVKFGRDWAIPIDSERPKDGRVTSGKYINWRRNQEKEAK